MPLHALILQPCFAEVNTPAQKARAVIRAPKGVQSAPKLLSRIEALRLLSKVEDAGLLSFGATRCNCKQCSWLPGLGLAVNACAAPRLPTDA